jgi:hypothetical protein
MVANCDLRHSIRFLFETVARLVDFKLRLLVLLPALRAFTVGHSHFSTSAFALKLFARCRCDAHTLRFWHLREAGFHRDSSTLKPIARNASRYSDSVRD